MEQSCTEMEKERGRRWHVRGRPTMDGAAEGSASEEWTSLSVEDSALRTDAGDPSSSKAKDPREWYPSFGTCDEEELPADVELPRSILRHCSKTAWTVKTSERPCECVQENKMEHLSRLLVLPPSDCLIFWIRLPSSTRPKSSTSVGDPVAT